MGKCFNKRSVEVWFASPFKNLSSSSHGSVSPQGPGPDWAMSDPDTGQRCQHCPRLRICDLFLVSGHDEERGRECGNGVTAAQAYDLHLFLPLPGIFTFQDGCSTLRKVFLTNSFTYAVSHLILTIQDLPVDTDPEERFICAE